MEKGRLDGQAVKNKEAFDAELRVLYQASKILEDRNERGQDCTILSDSTAAIARARSDRTGPGQRFAITLAEVYSCLVSQGNVLTLRWVPCHSGIGGGEVADDWVKIATESPLGCRPEVLPPRDQLCPYDENGD